ncbi:MAG TPA: MMPL family transporter [Spirochaetota bacterium]|nr:MMPL family transporter [Spirochaetota bacterium]HPR37622.1 MMPL family transporter [Spirochaetota bacterium]
MYKKLLHYLSITYRRPKLAALCGLLVTALFASAIPFIQFDNDIKNFLALDHPHRVSNDRLNEVFGSSEMILIGIESDNAYSKETVEYIRWLQGEIEKLNWGYPAKSISGELNISTDEANMLIDAVNRYEIQGKDALKTLLTNPEQMTNELFWDADFSEKIARKMKRTPVERLLQLYKFPVDEIKSVNNTDFIRGEGDKFVVEKLIEPENADNASLQRMKERVKSWSLYDRLLYSADDRLTVLSVQMNPVDINLRKQFNIEIEKIIKASPKGNLDVYMAGEPVVTDRVSSSMGDDLKRLLPFVMLVMLIILYIIFRHYEGVVFPMIAMIFSVIWTLGTMSILGIPMSMVSISIPTVLTAVASAYGIHFMTHYFMSPESGRYESCADSMKVSGLAIVMAALTTAAGFGSLATSDMTHIKNYGIITAIGVFYSLVITVTLIPVFLLLRKNRKPDLAFVKKEGDSRDVSSRFLFFIESKLGGHPGKVLVAGVIIVVISLAGMLSVKVSMNTMDFFQEGSEIKNADEKLNAKLSGTQLLNINIESSDGSAVITPEVLSKVESFQKELESKYNLVGKTVSVNDFLKKMNQEMHGGDAVFYKLPETTQMAKEYLLLYSGDIDNMISKEMDKIRIHLSIRRGSMSDLAEIRGFALEYFGDDFRKSNNVTVNAGGFLDLMIEANILVFKGQISSLALSLVVVSILMYIIFRNIKLTLISLIPLLIGIAMNFGLMGFLNIPLNAATALVASISIGMGIDYSIHFITQYRNSMEELNDVDKAVRKTYEGTGRAILSNAASVMAGFLVLLFSEFPVIAQCGGLIAFTVTVTGFAAIIVIPAAMRVFNRPASAGKQKVA